MEAVKTAFNEIVLGNKEVPTETPTQPIWHPTEKMHCLVYRGKKQIEYEEHPRPCITAPTDILLKVTATTVCGSDLHLYKGTFLGMRSGDIPGHEFLGIVEETGGEVQKLKKGQRVVVSFAITCGHCEYCKQEEYTCCSTNNPSKTVEIAYGDQCMAAYGYSHLTGAVPGGQADYVRVALADQNCMVVPDDLPDEKALYLTDIVPTSYHGCVLGEVEEGKTVGIWGLGPIGLMACQWAKLLGAKRVIAIDTVPERLALARDRIGVEVIDYKSTDVVDTIHKMLGGDSLDVAIECVGFDFPQSWLHKLQMKAGLETDSAEILTEIFKCTKKRGNVAIIGDYYAYANHFPIGIMMEKGLIIRGGQCPVIKYWRYCLEKVQSGEIDPTIVVTDKGSLSDGPLIYERMSNLEHGCIKSFLRPDHGYYNRSVDENKEIIY